MNRPFQILTALEVLFGEAYKTLFLKVLGSGTGEGDVHQLTLDIQVPAAPQRVDAAVAIDGIAVQTEALQAVQSVECIYWQLGELVLEQDPVKERGK